MLKTKFSKHLLWLRAYTEACADLVDLSRLKSVKLSLYRSDTPPSYHGTCERLANNKSYKIIVRTYDKSTRRWPMCALSQEQILSNYSHELSHIKIFEDNSVDRFILETKIYSRFGEILKARGYEQTLNKI